MSKITLMEGATADTPATDKVVLYVKADGNLYKKDDTGTEVQVSGSAVFTAEQAQDVVGAMLLDTATIDLVYDDPGATLSANVIPGGISHTAIANIGTNSHATIDTHLANTSNPHAVTKTQVGLGNADNTSDVNKPVSTAQQTAIDAKVSDTAYNATSWDAVTTIAPSKNAVRDELEIIIASVTAAISDTAYNATSWDAVTGVAPSKNAVRDQIETMLTSIALKMVKTANLSDVASAATSFNNISPVTTRGDLIRRGATNNERVALGTANQRLGSDGTDAVWQDQTGTVSFMIEKGSTWDTQVIPVWQVFKDMGVTITQVDATVMGSSSPALVFNLEERSYASLASAGVDVFASDQTADADGLRSTTFSNAVLDATDHLVFTTTTSAETGTVDRVMITVYFKRNAT